jgi:nucleoside-diphosphate-sugar epimerase
MNRHVVLGAGQIGAHLTAQLVEAGHDVKVVSRNGTGPAPGARPVAGDLTDPSFAANAAHGAEVVYFCLNATNYDRWPQEFPPLQRAAVHAATANNARLVVLDNLYSYGPTHGRPLVETMPTAATSAKARTRMDMTRELLDAHRAGTLDVRIGRASDFFGPGITRSALGEQVVGAALHGRRAQTMGDPDAPHSYSYGPDVARALIRLGASDVAPGRVWHLPIAETLTTRQMIELIYQAAGRRPRLTATGRQALTLAGLFKPELRELRHTLYQFADRWVVDDTSYRTAFGDTTTALPVAVKETVDWYRHHHTRENKK